MDHLQSCLIWSHIGTLELVWITLYSKLEINEHIFKNTTSYTNVALKKSFIYNYQLI